MDIKSVFDASSKSVWQFLCENGQGLYVPPYQRQYSWSAQNIERLFEDISHGLNLLALNGDSVTFLGTIIAIHDKTLSTVQPIVRNQTPRCVMSIIDGQQRLTTLLLTYMSLHDEIRTRFKKIQNDESPESKWLSDVCKSLLPEIQKTFEEDMNHGESRYYPRMIRAYEDCWSRDSSTLKYTSPIANFINLFGKHIRNDNGDIFSYAPPDNIEDTSRYDFLIHARKEIQKGIKEVTKPDSAKYDFPTDQKILNSDELIEALYFEPLPDSVKNKLLVGDSKIFNELFRLTLFAKFFVERVAITVVTASNEDYAFDMFESLNTTGEPLTAFETFKPRIIDSESLVNYEKSESRQYCEIIEGYLESFTKPNEKQDATANLLVTFALAEDGDKLSKRLSDQRRFFKAFDRLEDISAKRAYLEHMAHASSFLRSSWSSDITNEPKIEGIQSLDEGAKLALHFLKKIRHTITQPLIVRYFSEFTQARSDNVAQAESNLIETIKAITAFHVLWRGSRPTTDGIDAIYRSLMSDGCKETGLPPLKRTFGGSLPDASELKGALRAILANQGGIRSAADWNSRLLNTPSYKNNQLAQLILLAASDDGFEDASAPGLILKGRAGLMPMFNFAKFTSDDVSTVEHIAPQNPVSADGWDELIYENPVTVDTLGNLTLLPQVENSSIGNSSWVKKRHYYKMLAAETPASIDALMSQAKSMGVTISDSSEKIIERSKYLPMLRSISLVEGGWSSDLIAKRTECIGQLAWEKISPWLDY